MLRRWFSFGPHYQCSVLGEVREKERDPPSWRIVTTSQGIEDELDVREDRGKTLRPQSENYEGRWRAHFIDRSAFGWVGWKIVLLKMCIIHRIIIDSVKNELFSVQSLKKKLNKWIKRDKVDLFKFHVFFSLFYH